MKGAGGKIQPGSTELRKLLKEFKPGYHLRAASNGKHAVHGPDGQQVRMPSGLPLLLANSPGGGTIATMRARLRQAGVIA